MERESVLLDMSGVDTAFLVWGSAYVVLKWTVGLWALRRVKAYLSRRRALSGPA